jgi:uncharacterized protein (TIGR03435 family)
MHPRITPCLAMLAGMTGLLYGQSASTAATFEVASVKPASPPDVTGRVVVRATGIPGTPAANDPGRFTAENWSLTNLIAMAYNIPSYRLSASPELNRALFDVEARMAADTTKDQFMIMLQNLLAERFTLKVHWETRPMNLFELLVRKNGPKLKEATADAPGAAAESASSDPVPTAGPPKRGPDGFPIPPPGNQTWMLIMGGKGTMRGHNETTAQMALKFSNQIGRPVVDATRLPGKYDYTLNWSTVATRDVLAPPPPADGTSPVAGDETQAPSLFTAVQEQLGLVLQPQKGPVRMLIVDHVEKTPKSN